MDNPEKERITQLLLLSFIESFTNHSFHKELETVAKILDLQGSEEDGEYLMELNGAGQPSVTRSTVVKLGIVLAHRGENMESRIDLSHVSKVHEILTNPSLSEDDRMRCLVATLEQIMPYFPEHEKNERNMLILSMQMAKKSAQHMPNLLFEIVEVFGKLIQKLCPCLTDLINSEMH
ncbi:BH3-interacting domain death agonist-like [Heterocephalus glaber]|uniref:BH3-interacting domain death agonist n=1 Tax=Heterocephalus glaber TaxID=10181 RepID=A0AAX6QKF6_HETGA|nr:BH3-interacting domain death agonist-like [Heterocephalus glaber]